MYEPIDAYGVIGDLRTVALVSRNCSIDFVCWPEFDAPTIFAALLDDRKGGSFKINPRGQKAGSRQMYLPHTNILITRFLTDDGIAEIMDFMPIGFSGAKPMIVRQVKTVRGQIKYRLVCDPKFNYGQSAHKAVLRKNGALFESQDGTSLFLRTDMPLKTARGSVTAEFSLKTAEAAYFILGNASEGIADLPIKKYTQEALETTANFWRRWIKGSTYQGRWKEAVDRSALILKLLTCEKHGSMVASPSFGLPEVLRKQKNWDYRYTWVRNACFSLNVLMRLGYMREAQAFMQWIEKRCCELETGKQLQIMYGINGRRNLKETRLSHWEGYKKSHPVHIGNAAFDQLQLDIYGELLQSIYLYNKFGRAISVRFWKCIVRLMEWLGRNWQRPDKGIWEIRGDSQQFLYSKMMCWMAFDQAVKLVRKRRLPAPVRQWARIRDAIKSEIRKNYWDHERRCFTQFKGSKALDASALIMPRIGFIDGRDPRWLSTLRAIEEELVDDYHVHRYRVHLAADDGLPGEVGTFCMCTFWYVEGLARCGRLDEARVNFEKMLGYANHVGLYAEELGAGGEGLGNFPQAFTHLSLINAALDLNEYLDKAGKD